MAAILIIDDDPAVCTLLEEGLGHAGHQAIVCRDARDLFNHVKSQSADLLITDIFMDETDGLELIPRVRVASPRLKIIAISGAARLTDHDFLPVARQLGAHATFHKPIDLKLLLDTIARLLSAGEILLKHPFRPDPHHLKS